MSSVGGHCGLVGLLVLGLLPGASRAADAAEAERLLAAAQGFETQLAASPEDFDARLGAARALNQVMAIRTHGNLPRVDGLQDTPDNRALWAELGARALEHARVAEQLRPDSIEAATELAVAYMFYSSSLGILHAILTGAGGEYQQHARRVIELDPAHDDAIGHTLLASFFLVAPWPVRDLDAARDGYERAAALAPASARNQYLLGVYFARAGEPEQARAHLQRAAAMPCTEHSERLFCGWIGQESQRAISGLGE